MEKCLTIYDVTGIQSFIFASNKAKENIGASIYVQEIFEKGLVKIIEREFKNVKTIWSKSEKLSGDNLNAEIIYIGGGNAMVLFDTRDNAVKVTKKLSKKILDDTQATLGVVVAYLKTDLENFITDRDKLFEKLSKNKSSFINSTPLRGISITRETPDGLPSSGNTNDNKAKNDENNYISDVAAKKRGVTNKENKFSELLSDTDGKKFPIEFDDLGQKEGESHIAVVHIDGNSMGAFIDEQLNGKISYDEAIPVIRKISSELQKLYSGIFKKMVNYTEKAIEKEKVKNRLNFKDKDNLPIRPIILNGDDVTFVCDGRIAIQLVSYFLKELSNVSIKINDNENEVSACAGIAIVKSHFPFFRAYELAEELCNSAKKKAKHFNKEKPGNWVDYHIVYSGFQTDLNAMRKEQYNIPDMETPIRDVKDKFPQYNLLLRPFCVTGNSDEVYQWKNIKKLYEKMVTGSKKFPRSRLKDLRNAFITSEKAVILKQKENSSRKYKLPSFEIRDDVKACDNKNIFQEYQTPYFEVLELLDFYIPEFDKGE